ncbi:hypothetical protein ACOSQ2_007202 [Xanthoceras sorbifolium]
MSKEIQISQRCYGNLCAMIQGQLSLRAGYLRFGFSGPIRPEGFLKAQLSLRVGFLGPTRFEVRVIRPNWDLRVGYFGPNGIEGRYLGLIRLEGYFRPNWE